MSVFVPSLNTDVTFPTDKLRLPQLAFRANHQHKHRCTGTFWGCEGFLPKFPQNCPKKKKKTTAFSFTLHAPFQIKALQAFCPNFPQNLPELN